MTIHRVFLGVTFLATRSWLRPVSRGNRHFTVGGGRLRQSGPRQEARLLRQPALEVLTRSARADSPRQVGRNKFRRERRRRRRLLKRGGAVATRAFRVRNPLPMLNTLSSVSVRESRIQYLCDPQWFKDTASRITDSACKNQLVVVSVQYGPFNPYIPIRSTTIGKSRVAKDPIAMHTSWRSNSDIASVTSFETRVAGFEEREVAVVLESLRDCGPVVLLFFYSFGYFDRFELVVASVELLWSCLGRLELVAVPSIV
ncbi:small conductance mechanosensitive ion channel family [Dorcoceras hygrometricum]|uniref:Small conductance mechanosensitive ion channel family n=1 Tax=Dorcoceras hygrometricum TaxID=472368 RepID=A0A2Z7A8H4_9LAMI|nr:small conductance mechanosensitive ion channel family [Dorcoceras hygrometricum]